MHGISVQRLLFFLSIYLFAFLRSGTAFRSSPSVYQIIRPCTSPAGCRPSRSHALKFDKSSSSSSSSSDRKEPTPEEDNEEETEEEKQAAMMEMMDQSVQKAIIEARTRRIAGGVEDRATQVRRGRKRRKGEEMRVALTLDRIRRQQEYSMRAMGVDTDTDKQGSEKQAAETIAAAMEAAQEAISFGQYATAVRLLREIEPLISYGTQLGGEAYLELAMAYEMDGQRESAKKTYRTLIKLNGSRNIRGDAKTLLFRLESDERLRNVQLDWEDVDPEVAKALRQKYALNRDDFATGQSIADLIVPRRRREEYSTYAYREADGWSSETLPVAIWELEIARENLLAAAKQSNPLVFGPLFGAQPVSPTEIVEALRCVKRVYRREQMGLQQTDYLRMGRSRSGQAAKAPPPAVSAAAKLIESTDDEGDGSDGGEDIMRGGMGLGLPARVLSIDEENKMMQRPETLSEKLCGEFRLAYTASGPSGIHFTYQSDQDLGAAGLPVLSPADPSQTQQLQDQANRVPSLTLSDARVTTRARQGGRRTRVEVRADYKLPLGVVGCAGLAGEGVYAPSSGHLRLTYRRAWVDFFNTGARLSVPTAGLVGNTKGQLLLLDDRLMVTSTAVPTKRFAQRFKAMQVKGCSVWCRPVDAPLPSQTAIRIVHTRDWLFSKYGQVTEVSSGGGSGDSGGSLPMAASNTPDSVAAVGA